LEFAEAGVSKVENYAESLSTKSASLSSAKMAVATDEVDEMLSAARDDVVKAKKQFESLSQGTDTALQEWLHAQMKQLEHIAQKFEPRLARLAATTAKFREDTKAQEAEELLALEKKALGIIKYHQRAKYLRNEAVFHEIDTDGDNRISEAEFLAFFKTCERAPKKTNDKTMVKNDTKKDNK